MKKNTKRLIAGFIATLLAVMMIPGMILAEGTGKIVIHEGGNVTIDGENASKYSTASYYAVNNPGNYGNEITSINTEGNVTNEGTSITFTGVRGIDNGSSELVITSISDGINISNTGWIGAINQQSSSSTDGSSNLNIQGVGDIKVKSMGSYGAKGLGVYSAKNTDITKNQINVGAKSLTVESEGTAYGIQGTLAGRTTTINIPNSVTIKGMGESGTAYATNLTAATPVGNAKLNFGSLIVSSINSFAYGFHCAGGTTAEVALDGNMNIIGATSALGFRLAGNANFTVKGKDDKAIDLIVQSTSDESDGADIGGTSSTAKLNLIANNFHVTSEEEKSCGIYLRNEGTEYAGSVNNFLVSGKSDVKAIYVNEGKVEGQFGAISAISSDEKAYAIYAKGGTTTISPVSAKEGTTIVATGKTGSYAVYAENNANVSLVDADVTGDIYNDASIITFDYKTIFKSNNVNNNGAIQVDMTGATENSYKLIDYTGNETPNYGTEETNYMFAEGKDNGYVIRIKDNDLYAVLVRNVSFDSDNGTAVVKQEVQYNGYAKKPTNPTKEGNIFAGWCYKNGAEQGQQFLFDSTPITENIDLIANWIESNKEGNITVKDTDEGIKAETSIKKSDIPLTKKEVEDIENGSVLDVNLLVKVEEAQKVIEKELIKESMKENQKLGMYLDCSMFKTLDGEPIGRIFETLNPITIVLTVPEKLRADGRVYSIIRVHNDKAEELFKGQANKDWKISFETDKFSTYAIVYEGGNPDTGDHNNVWLLVGLGGLSLLGIIALAVLMLKKKSYR